MNVMSFLSVLIQRCIILYLSNIVLSLNMLIVIG